MFYVGGLFPKIIEPAPGRDRLRIHLRGDGYGFDQLLAWLLASYGSHDPKLTKPAPGRNRSHSNR